MRQVREAHSRELHFNTMDEYEMLFSAIDCVCKHGHPLRRHRLRRIGKAALSRTMDGSRAGCFPEFLVTGDDVDLVLQSLRQFTRAVVEDPMSGRLDRFQASLALDVLEANLDGG